VLKILTENFRQAVVFRVRPQVRVEPVQPVRRAPANGLPKNRFIWVENGELFQELFRFAQSVGLFEDSVAANGACYRCDELNDRLMGQANRVFDDAAPENLGRNLLLLGKAAIEPINQDVSINESGHACRDPLFSILGREAARAHASSDVCGGVRWPDRTNGAVTLDLEVRPACLEE
jgi:hypothetical protein